MAKPLLIAKTGSTFGAIKARHGDFDAWFVRHFETLGRRCEVVDVVSACSLPAANGYAGVLITGSPAMVTDREPWSEALAAWLRDAADDLPILGVCYGHQLLAHAFGGQVDYHPLGREIGTRQVNLQAAAVTDPLLAGLQSSFVAHLTHAQSVTQLPPGAQLLASNEYEPHQAFRLGERIWGLQFHPEFNADIMRDYVQSFADKLREEGRDVDGLLRAITDTPVASSVLSRFHQLLD